MSKVAPALGEGWEARGAIIRAAEQKPIPTQEKLKVVTFADLPTPQALNEPFSGWDIISRKAPHYAIFDLEQMWSHNYGGFIPGHFVFLWTEMVMDSSGAWSYMEWEYNLGLEKIASSIYTRKHGHLVYAVYEKIRGKHFPDLYKLVMTRGK